MPVSNETAAATVHRYLELVASGTAAQIIELYADDATVEDPVGSPVLTGREAIEAFYASFAAMPKTTRLLTLRTAGGEAAFHFEIATDTGSGTATMAPLEVMTFDDDGRITTMRAWWSDADLGFA